MKYFLTILVALALTELVECIIVMLWENNRKLLVTVLICNLVTNPAVNGAMMAIRHFSDNAVIYYTILGFLEIVTIVIEAIIIEKSLGCGNKKAYKISLAINCCSFFFGLALMLSGIAS